MNELVENAALFASGAGTAAGVLLGLAWRYNDEIVRKLRYKRYDLPCPACRDEETDEPTGLVTPDNPLLQQMAQQKFGGELPSWPCSTCEGTRTVSYEFPRNNPPEINDRQIVESVAPDQLTPKKRRTILRRLRGR